MLVSSASSIQLALSLSASILRLDLHPLISEDSLVKATTSVTPSSGIRIGIDLGGTKIEGVAIDATGQVIARQRVPTPKNDYAGTVNAIVGVVRHLEQRVSCIPSVGIGIPGTIVRSTGLVKNANSVWLNGHPLEFDISAALGRPVRCANDANCFAISEAHDGSASGYSVVFGVIIGTGCGGALVFNGHQHAGPHGIAGEWGHNPLPWATPDELPGPQCYCGKRGCIEMWISGTGLMRDFLAATGQPLDGAEIVAASEDPAAALHLAATAALDRLEDRMARSLAEIVNILDPDVIVLGGGLSKLDRLYRNLPARITPYTFGGADSVRIVKPLHGDASGVRGAAWLWD